MNRLAIFSLFAATLATALKIQDLDTNESVEYSTIAPKRLGKASQGSTLKSQGSDEKELVVIEIEIVDPLAVLFEQMLVKGFAGALEGEAEQAEVEQPEIEQIDTESESEIDSESEVDTEAETEVEPKVETEEPKTVATMLREVD